MSGFFKKLFNRITGRSDAPAPESAADAPALPAPEAPSPAQPAAIEPAPPVPVGVPEEPAAPPPPAPKPEAKPASAAKAKPAPAKAPAKAPGKPTAKKAVPPAASKAKTAKAPEPKLAPAKLKESKPAPDAKVKPVEKPAPPPKREEVKAALPRPEPLPVPVPTPVAPPPEPEPVAAPAPAPVPRPVPPPPPSAAVAARAGAPERGGWFSRLREGLSKSSKSISGSISSIFTKRKLDAETLQDLEDTLIQADLGVTVAERIIKAVSQGRYDKEIDPEEVKQILASEVGKVLKPVEVPFNFGSEKPFVILVVGVNGSGKTTTIGKLGAIAAGEGFKVKFAACDTFRAAAIEQLTVWGKRIGADTVSRPPGSDAAGLAFDAMKAATEDGTDIMFIDTAGRLHNKTYLMDELDKVVRVIKKYDAAAPHAVLLVLDATTGQNALAQAEAFTKVAGVTGLIMTKLDGTARGGILVAIAERFKLPIHAIGVGESIEDLQPFDAEAFSRAIAGLEMA
jgi:fused signal recognition particle receptor